MHLFSSYALGLSKAPAHVVLWLHQSRAGRSNWNLPGVTTANISAESRLPMSQTHSPESCLRMVLAHPTGYSTVSVCPPGVATHLGPSAQSWGPARCQRRGASAAGAPQAASAGRAECRAPQIRGSHGPGSSQSLSGGCPAAESFSSMRGGSATQSTICVYFSFLHYQWCSVGSRQRRQA